MSWLRSSPLRQSLTRSSNNGATGQQSTSSNSAVRQRSLDTATDCDPRACYDSFCKHWQQAFDIIQRSEPAKKAPTHDDVLGVVSHLDFMVTLLLVELHHCNKISLPAANGAEATPPAPCLEFMLSENLLDKLYEWGITTGRYANAVRLEQLKLYELLVSHSRHQLLCHEPFLRPLLKILGSSQGEIFPPDLEKRLVILLNQLCVVLMQNVHLLDLFFFSAAQEQYKQQNEGAISKEHTKAETTSTNFIIFSLLIPYVHREGSLGHQARDALLLCMALSQKNSNIGTYIAQYSSMCPLLVTGLGGLYSRLPNSIEITSIDWHRITPDDITDIPELTLFMNALEFCNAVVQVAHDLIKHQLLDFMYQGFIVPVLGPAILQTLKGKHFQTNIDSQISAMSYLDLILRSVTEPGLLRAFVKFLLDTEKFDGKRILDTLIERLRSTDPNLCLVTMALFDTLLGLNCEDLMLELVLKYLLPGKHIPISYRHKINKIDAYTKVSDFFLELTPNVMKRASELTKHKHVGETINSSHNSSAQTTNTPPLPSPTSSMSKTIGANWNYYGVHTGDSLYSNFHAYLYEAHCKIEQCRKACAKWSNSYKYQKWPPKQMNTNTAQTMDLIKEFFAEFNVSPSATNVMQPVSSTQVNLAAANESQANTSDEKNKFDSLQSVGDSSGYESFKWRPNEEEGDLNDIATSTQNTTVLSSDAENESGRKSETWWRVSNNRCNLVLTDLDFSEDLFAQGTVSLGPFLNAIWGKLQTFTSNTLYVNLHLTGLITHLAWYPLPLLHSILLRPDIVITSDTPSFHQVLRILKQQIDAELPVIEDSLELIDVARSHLIDREFRLINARKNEVTSPLHFLKPTQQQQHQHKPRFSLQTTYANISSSSPVQVTPSSSYDPFKRNDTKRKSISKSITSIFSRKPNGSSQTSGAGLAATSSGSSQSNATTSQEKSLTRETSLSTIPVKTERLTAEQQPCAAPSTVANQTLPTQQPSSSIGSMSTLTSMNTATLGHGSSGGIGGGGNSEPVSLDSISSMGAIANTSGTERTRDLSLCAVLLDEWLKELAAIAQEQTLLLINDNI